MKVLLLICALVASLSAQTYSDLIDKVPDKKKFSAVYDKFKDQTVIGTHIKIRHPKGKMSVMRCEIKAVVTGAKPGSPVAAYWLIFVPEIGTESWQFLRDHRLILLLDGERVDMGNGKHDGTVRLGGVDERVAFNVSRSLLQELAKAVTIELQLGQMEGIVEKDGRPRLATFLDLTLEK